MIEQLLDSPVVYQFDTRFMVPEACIIPPPAHVTQLPSEALFITTVYTYLFYI